MRSSFNQREIPSGSVEDVLRLVDARILRIDHLVHPVRLLGHDEMKRRRTARGPFANRIEQPGSGRRLMCDDEDVGRL